MSEESKSTRRSFLKGGAIVAAPLAAMSAPAAAALAGGEARNKLARLEDEKAIRGLHQHWMARVNAGDPVAAAQCYASESCACAMAGIAAVAPARTGAPDVIEVAADGRHARATYAATVETETLIAPENTLAQMLHAQGEGYVRASEARTLRADYVKARDGRWAIAGLAFEKA